MLFQPLLLLVVELLRRSAQVCDLLGVGGRALLDGWGLGPRGFDVGARHVYTGSLTLQLAWALTLALLRMHFGQQNIVGRQFFKRLVDSKMRHELLIERVLEVRFEDLLRHGLRSDVFDLQVQATRLFLVPLGRRGNFRPIELRHIPFALDHGVASFNHFLGLLIRPIDEKLPFLLISLWILF